jgi:hypothetical protein
MSKPNEKQVSSKTSGPFAVMKAKFGSKDKLVEELLGLLESDISKEDLRARLRGVSNTKLMRLHAIASVTKQKFGSHEKLVEATAGALGRSKDKDYVGKLGTLSNGRLLDMNRSAERRTKRSTTGK